MGHRPILCVRVCKQADVRAGMRGSVRVYVLVGGGGGRGLGVVGVLNLLDIDF